jgi:hypothetical protein
MVKPDKIEPHIFEWIKALTIGGCSRWDTLRIKHTLNSAAISATRNLDLNHYHKIQLPYTLIIAQLIISNLLRRIWRSSELKK